MVKVRSFVASAVALVVGVAFLVIVAEIAGYSIPVLNAIPHAIGIEAGGE